LEATKDLAIAYKINFAFYEQYGVAGYKALYDTFKAIPPSHFVIADAKRGDIGNTSMAYAKSILTTSWQIQLQSIHIWDMIHYHPFSIIRTRLFYFGSYLEPRSIRLSKAKNQQSRSL
jgi:orotidine-5'-phosphate decarboxylase